MAHPAEFVEQLRDALGHLYDYPRLAGHPLALRFWPEEPAEGPGRAQRLQRLLLESIEELHPPAASPPDALQARCYSFLSYRYIEDWPPEEIARELACSRRGFFRLQRQALNMLAPLLSRKLPSETPLPPPAADLLEAEAQRVLSRSERIDPAELMEGVVQDISSLAAQHGVSLTCDVSDGLPAAQGNRTLWRQVLLRTLSYFITQPGARRLKVRVRPDHRGIRVELLVEPRPSGEEQAQPADGFAAALDSERRLVRMMYGQLHGPLAGDYECGCRLIIPAGSQRTLLVIEDNDAVVEAFRRYLVGYGYQVVGATSSADAVQAARGCAPTAITLDVMMPGRDGWEVLRSLKDDPLTCEIPVIICSVLDDPALAASLGAAAYLRKPITQAELLSALGRLNASR